MFDQILQAFQQGREWLASWFSSLSQENKDLLVRGWPVLLAVLVGSGYMYMRVPYRPLFSGLSMIDAASVVRELDANNTPYQLRGDGSVVEVPAEILQRTRLEMAGKGLGISGGVGFEIFEKTPFGASEFTQRVNYLRALQGELSRTISNLDAVHTGRVHLGLPLRTALLGRQEAPSASVIVGLKPGYKLSSLQLQGIINLVSNSVPRLVPQRVTVVDASGKLLQSGAGGPNGKMAKLYQLRLDLERTMEERIESMLLPVLGLNKVVARVSLEIDVRETELTRQEFDPSGKVVRSRRLQVGEPDASTEGIPGVQGNIPGGDGEKPADKTEEKSGDEPKETPRTKKSEMVTYELDHSTKRIIEPQGLIRRLSVAVMVDGKYEEDVYTPRTEEEMETLRAIIKRAVGFNEKRGDQIEMTNVPFRPQSELHPVVVKVPEPQQWFQSPFILAGGAAVFLLLLLTVGLLFRSGRRKSRARVSVRRARTQVTAGISGAVEKIEKITVSADPRREQLAQIARDYHDLTIQIIRMWLKEGRKGRPDVLNMMDEVEKEQEIEKAAQVED